MGSGDSPAPITLSLGLSRRLYCDDLTGLTALLILGHSTDFSTQVLNMFLAASMYLRFIIIKSKSGSIGSGKYLYYKGCFHFTNRAFKFFTIKVRDVPIIESVRYISPYPNIGHHYCQNMHINV